MDKSEEETGTIRKSIDEYCGYFLKEIGKVEKLEEILFKKIIFSIIIDTVGHVKSSNNKVRDRIVGLIDDFSTWSDKDRISLPQLFLKLQGNNLSSGHLYKEVKKKIDSWGLGRIYGIGEVDPDSKDIFLMAEGKERAIVEESRHVELFCQYRNTLVHEFREPGYGMEISSDNQNPYYLHCGEGWELTYPIGFFREICLNCIKEIRNYLENNNIDPYEQHKFGSIWKPPKQYHTFLHKGATTP